MVEKASAGVKSGQSGGHGKELGITGVHGPGRHCCCGMPRGDKMCAKAANDPTYALHSCKGAGRERSQHGSPILVNPVDHNLLYNRQVIERKITSST